MPVIPRPTQPTHDLHGARFTSLVTPSRGSSDTSLWQVDIDPGIAPTPHSLTREEVFVILDGKASVTFDGVAHYAETGDAVVVPAGVVIEVTNAGDTVLRMHAVLPVGGQAQMADGTTFTPPWAE
jgi:quercetin dioxygenase-like cupin family protein